MLLHVTYSQPLKSAWGKNLLVSTKLWNFCSTFFGNADFVFTRRWFVGCFERQCKSSDNSLVQKGLLGWYIYKGTTQWCVPNDGKVYNKIY